MISCSHWGYFPTAWVHLDLSYRWNREMAEVEHNPHAV